MPSHPLYDSVSLRRCAPDARAWPFEEARRLLKRIEHNKFKKKHVLFQTGYGPSGLPHIGTFGEVLRTSMVRHAFSFLSGIPSKLVVFSDDMDGLRKIPDNIPNPEQLKDKIGLPLSDIPDPFGTHKSFGAHNNAKLKKFLNRFSFDYEFVSSTDQYRSGAFDEALCLILRHYDKVMQIMLPSLGEERKKTYSPFLPLCPESGVVLQAPVLEIDAEKNTILYRHPNGQEYETKVTGGKCKLQWKPDWAMRWYALGVDYEMSGKDLADSVRLSAKITKQLGGTAPQSMIYELFLDDLGRKISKSKGNGLSTNDWLAYAPQESLALFMYKKPRTAKKLYFDAIPRQVDEYIAHARALTHQKAEEVLENPVFHIQGHTGITGITGIPEAADIPNAISFSMLHNLVGACNQDDPKIIWHYIRHYAPHADPETMPWLDRLIQYAMRYYQDFIASEKQYHTPSMEEQKALQSLIEKLKNLGEKPNTDTIQTAIFDVGKEYSYDPIQKWFTLVYQTILGQKQGPRLGSFFQLYGLSNAVALLEKALTGALVKENI